MTALLDIAVLIGSLRTNSLSRKLVTTLTALAPPSIKLELIEIAALSFYNEDEDSSPPAPWVSFRQRIKRADALLFVTAEYNRSIPAALKNALDVGSRPYGQSAWNGKPAGVVSFSPGTIGGFAANHHLRQSLVALNVLTLPQPEVYLGGLSDNAFDEKGVCVNAGTNAFLGKFMTTYAAWIAREPSKTVA
ncbi:MAG: NAD(P)H-dependent oxidoreductase [Ottowia sp.]|nr:NAD(P)H-dependent oxidoreductase [Ottowia sp.]